MSHNVRRYFPLSYLLILTVATTVFTGRLSAAPELNGFIQPHGARRLYDADCAPSVTECDTMAADLITRIGLDGELSDSLYYDGQWDLRHDAALDESDASTRELYVEYNTGPFNARVGRQIITLGVGDLLFINDVFAKDWNAFFLGMPQQYLKRGTDGARFNWYSGSSNVEIILADFGEDHRPDPRRFILPQSARSGAVVAVEPDELEAAVKASTYLGSWEIAAYSSRVHYRELAPDSTAPPGERLFFPRLNTFGASATGPFAGGVLNIELGYYDSVDDPEGIDPGIANNQSRLLVGYSKQLWKDATLGIQLYNETMQDYSAYRDNIPASQPSMDRSRQVATLRLTQSLRYQTVTLNLFAFFGLSENDRYWIPSVRYSFSDRLWAEAGVNVFTGSEQGRFGIMHDNSNLFMTMRYSF